MTPQSATAAGPTMAPMPPGQARGGIGMTLLDIAADTVVSVMLADGWHRVTRGSLVISPLGFGPGANLDLPGFRFAEAEAGSPYQPTMLAGPLNSIIAVRLVNPFRAAKRPDRPARSARSAGHGKPLPDGTRQ